MALPSASRIDLADMVAALWGEELRRREKADLSGQGDLMSVDCFLSCLLAAMHREQVFSLLPPKQQRQQQRPASAAPERKQVFPGHQSTRCV